MDKNWIPRRGTLSLWAVVVSLVLVPVATAGAPLALADRHPEQTDPAEARLDQSVVQVYDDNRAPEIEVSPVTVRFPRQENGSVSKQFTVSNVGNATLRVRTIDIVGPDRARFEDDFDGPVTLQPGERHSVTVTFTPTDGSARFATVHVLSNDSNAPQVNAWLTNTETVASVSPSRLVGNLTMVNSTIENATANTSQSINISWPLTRDDRVAVDALSFIPERSGDFAINVTKSLDQFGNMAAFNQSDGTESEGFVQIDHTIDNEDVRNVTVTFRVRKDRLAENETGPEDVALYRFQEGSWRELPTRLVSESDTHYFFEASSPGLSDFTVGVKQAKFQIADAVVTVTTITTGEGTEVLVQVENVGGADGTYSVRLISAGEVVDGQELSIAPGSSRLAFFERTYDQPGTYELFVNDHFVGNITVTDSGATVSPATETTTASDTGILGAFGPRFGVAMTLFGALEIVCLAVSRHGNHEDGRS